MPMPRADGSGTHCCVQCTVSFSPAESVQAFRFSRHSLPEARYSPENERQEDCHRDSTGHNYALALGQVFQHLTYPTHCPRPHLQRSDTSAGTYGTGCRASGDRISIFSGGILIEIISCPSRDHINAHVTTKAAAA